MVNKIYILIILSIMVMGLASSTELLIKGPYQKATNIVITQGCNCSYVYIKNIINPNGTIILSNVAMTNSGNGSFSYNLSKTYIPNAGIYTVEGYGDPDGTFKPWSYGLDVTNSGTTLQIGESILYVLLTIFIFLMLCVSLYLAWMTPYSNETDNLGFIIKVTRMKYVKMLFIATSYGLLLWVLNLAVGLSNNYISLGIYAGLLNNVTIWATRLSYIFGMLLLFMLAYHWIKDLNLIKQINQFGKVMER